MLYLDLVDQRTDDTRTRLPQPDPVAGVDGHGTGVSPGARAGTRPLVMALSVAGNTVLGGLFLGGLYLAPLGLDRLLSLL